MEHSAEAYLKRMTAAELEKALHQCTEGEQGKRYGYILPLIEKILDQKRKEEK